jgi:hypothetical protein
MANSALVVVDNRDHGCAHADRQDPLGADQRRRRADAPPEEAVILTVPASSSVPAMVNVPSAWPLSQSPVVVTASKFAVAALRPLGRRRSRR